MRIKLVAIIFAIFFVFIKLNANNISPIFLDPSVSKINSKNMQQTIATLDILESIYNSDDANNCYKLIQDKVGQTNISDIVSTMGAGTNFFDNLYEHVKTNGEIASLFFYQSWLISFGILNTFLSIDKNKHTSSQLFNHSYCFKNDEQGKTYRKQIASNFQRIKLAILDMQHNGRNL